MAKGWCCLQVTLSNGVEMPLVGFGSAGLGPDTKQAVKWALMAGYRLIDSAQVRSAAPAAVPAHDDACVELVTYGRGQARCLSM